MGFLYYAAQKKPIPKNPGFTLGNTGFFLGKWLTSM
jgi:hypothetical protein